MPDSILLLNLFIDCFRKNSPWQEICLCVYMDLDLVSSLNTLCNFCSLNKGQVHFSKHSLRVPSMSGTTNGVKKPNHAYLKFLWLLTTCQTDHFRIMLKCHDGICPGKYVRRIEYFPSLKYIRESFLNEEGCVS